jgi:hypothetical protein
MNMISGFDDGLFKAVNRNGAALAESGVTPVTVVTPKTETP